MTCINNQIYTFFVVLLSQFIVAQVSPEQMIVNMSCGINLGNVMSAPIEGNWAPEFTESYFEDVETAGFKTARIPIDFFGVRTSGDTSIYSKAAGTSGIYSGNASDYVVSPTYLDRVEQVITWSLNHNLITILDFHGSTLKSEFLYTFSPKDKWSAYYTEPTSAKRAADNDKFRAIWTAIANRFKNYSDNLLFEVVNESYFFLTAAEMDILNTDVIEIIRNSGGKNLYRNIIVTGGGKNSYEAPLQLGDALLNSDANLIATFHYYLPRAFTASSSASENDFDWGTSMDKAEVDADFEVVKAWADSKEIPVLLGEFGADNEGGYNYVNETYGAFGGPDNTSRVEFHRYLAEKSIVLGFAFTAWDSGDKSNKTIYKASTRTWVNDVKDSLFPASLNTKKAAHDIKFEVYPNPTNGYLQIKTNQSIKEIQFFDAVGSAISFQSDLESFIKLPFLENGIYFLKIKFKMGRSILKKIIVSKEF